jgi:3-(3-hydroxy-phenyl)propionate hydroxylase
MIELAVRMGHVMMPRNRMRAFLIQNLFRLLALYPAARDYFAEMKYKPKPFFSAGFLIDPGSVRKRNSLVGRLFPQPIVASGNTYTLLDDILGDGFALLASPGLPPRLIEETCQSTPASMSLRFVAVTDKEDPSRPAPPVVTVRDIRGEMARLLSGHPPGLFLLRPDRYVAAFFPPEELSSIWRAITELFSRTGPTSVPTAPEPTASLSH